MASDVDAKGAWVARVLGVRVASGQSGGGGDPLARVRAARAGWQSAVDTVDGQINALAKALRDSGDHDLGEIANTGLMTVTGGLRTKMMAALIDVGDSDIALVRKSGPKAASLAEKLAGTIGADERVAACDANDFGVPVTIQATLGGALAELAGALREAARA
jgi:hypothetical protein